MRHNNESQRGRGGEAKPIYKQMRVFEGAKKILHREKAKGSQSQKRKKRNTLQALQGEVEEYKAGGGGAQKKHRVQTSSSSCHLRIAARTSQQRIDRQAGKTRNAALVPQEAGGGELQQVEGKAKGESCTRWAEIGGTGGEERGGGAVEWDL